MNLFLSTLAGFVVSLLITFIAGYWNSRGVVALGDMRIPSMFIGMLVLFGGTAVSAAAGAFVPWTATVGRLVKKFRDLKTGSLPSAPKLPDQVIERGNVAAIPVRVEHLLGCVHHLRVALADDSEGQDLMDQIQIKIGRVSAQIAEKSQTGGA